MHTITRAKMAWAAGPALALVLAIPNHAPAQSVGSVSLRIASTPSAAEVELIGGRAGVTPLTISERDIYPNDYPDAREDMYGMVVLRHTGCEPLRHRVTQTDIKQGLQLRLDCDVATVQSRTAAAAPAPEPHALAAPPPLEPSSAVPQRRLRQLQVLQELLDEGLISPAEEQRVRRRILQLNEEQPD